MLIEIPNVKQYEPEQHRRWFQNAFFDLYVWSDPAGELLGFQLCYDKPGEQRALRYSRKLGYQHEGVDQPEDKPGRSMSAIFVANGTLDTVELGARFAQDAGDLPAAIRAFIVSHLDKYDGSRSCDETAAVVNDVELRRLLGNNPEKLAHLATLFDSESRKFVAALDTAISLNAFDAAKPALHSIKGMAALIGARDAASSAARLEALIRQRESPQSVAPPGDEMLRSEFVTLQKALRPYREWFASWCAPITPPINPD